MKVLITAVGQRTEHWTDLFDALARQPDLDLTVVVADVSELTIAGLEHCAQRSAMRFHHVPHVLSERRSGHMASIVIRPGALRKVGIERPDVVHIIGEAAYLSTRQIIRHRASRWPDAVLTHYAAQNVVTRFPPPFPTFERMAYRAVQHMLPITPAALAVLRAKGYRGGATIVPLGVDAARFRPVAGSAPARPFTVGFVGRLEPHKGVADLIAAAERIDADLLIVGRGSLADQVGQAVQRRPGRVRHHDWLDHDQLAGVLASMGALALPSVEVVQRNVVPWVGIPLREQFGRVLAEAMACGIPVVGSDVGEIGHVIGDAGLVFRAGDVDDLSAKLARLRDDRVLAGELGRRGRARVESELNWECIATTMRGVWGRLCSGGGAAGAPDMTLPAPRSLEKMVTDA